MNESTLVQREEWESDLDWLARNVHVWPESTPHIIPVGDCVFEFGATFFENHVCLYHSEFADSKVIHKHQWLSRRAELQNKPSWSKAEEWAEWLAQDSYGCWGFFQKKPLMHALSWIARSGYYQIHSPGNSLLGDWRDTLEKRTEKDEFEQFVSVEDAATDIQQVITPSKYTKTIHGASVDVYDVLQAWGVSNPALQHLIKKALQCGQRGHKDNAQDLQDIIDSAIRAKELES